MAQYNLSGNIDPSKVFLINRSELEGRIDPEQYHVERIQAIKRLKKNNEILRLKDILNNKKKTTTDFIETDVYVGLENITSNTGEYIPTTDKLSISSANVFRKGQILFPKLRPYLNKVYLAEFDGICSTEFHVFDSDRFSNEFLAIYLRSDLIVHQTKHLMTGNTLPRLQTEDISNLPIPNLPQLVQDEIVCTYQLANKIKQQKESEAKALLESIDSYLLKELGITLPEKTEVKAEDIPTWMNPENLLVKNGRLFMTSSREIIGQRLDPKPYDTNTKNLKQSIANCKTKSVVLKSLIIHSCAGDWGVDETEAEEDQENRKYLVIRATEFDNKYNLNLDNTRVKYRLIKQSKLIRMDIQENDLLIEKSGGSPDQPVGRIALLSKEVLNSDTHIGYSNFIHKIRIDSTKINPEYLFYFLKTMHNVKLTETMQSQTNGIRNLIMTNYLTQNIPLPDKDRQETIVQNISELLAKAKQLENEAMQILMQAKSEIEQMILKE